MNLTNYCFDTHPLIWYFKGSKTLSKRAKSILDQVFLGELTPFISAIVLLEAFHLSLKDPGFVFSKFVKFLSEAKFVIVPLGDDVLKVCFKLPKGINIHDRIVAATAISTYSWLVTKDEILRSTLPLETIW